MIEEGVDPAREREIESILAIANGYLGVRASLAERGGFSHPATFAAGVYVEDADLGLGPTLAVLPDWLHIEIEVEGVPLSLESGQVIDHRRLLDMHQGVLWREWRHEDIGGRITGLTYWRLASLADRHLLLHSVTATAENYAGRISFATHLGPSNGGGSDLEIIAAESRLFTCVWVVIKLLLLGNRNCTAELEDFDRKGSRRRSWRP